MKLITIIFFLVPGFCFAQDAPKKSTLINVKGVSFESVASTLLDQGFFIDKKDESLKTIVTLERPIDNSATEIMKNNIKRLLHVVYFIRIKDSVAYITGKFNAPELSLVGKEFEIIQNTGAKKSVYGLTWEAMDDFAHSLHGEISYSKN